MYISIENKLYLIAPGDMITFNGPNAKGFYNIEINSNFVLFHATDETLVSTVFDDIVQAAKNKKEFHEIEIT